MSDRIPSHPPSTLHPPPSTRIAFVVNGSPTSAMGERAKAFATRLSNRFTIRLFHRTPGKVRSIVRLLCDLLSFQPQVCYVFDMAFSGVLSAGLCKHLTGCKVIVDTGDAIVDLARSMGRGPAGRLLTWLLEGYSLRMANRIVVRGRFHQQLLARRGIRADFIPDGVSVNDFVPPLPPARIPGMLRIGLVGSSIWSPRLGICYGWELVELIRLLADRPVEGVLIGDGSGIEILRKRCEEYGIAGRVHFPGRVAYESLPAHLWGMDICLSTQTNDIPGQVRTTGKLPLYLAAGRFVLATRVGEAARILPEAMLVDYQGQVDRDYPGKLRDRIIALLDMGTHFAFRPECMALCGNILSMTGLLSG